MSFTIKNILSHFCVPFYPSLITTFHVQQQQQQQQQNLSSKILESIVDFNRLVTVGVGYVHNIFTTNPKW